MRRRQPLNMRLSPGSRRGQSSVGASVGKPGASPKTRNGSGVFLMFQGSLAQFGRLASLVLAGICIFAFSPLRADEFSAAQKAEIESVVKSYLIKNPEILREVAAELDA